MSGEDKTPHRIGAECPEHGLRFNPQRSSGCVLCERESRTSQPRLFILSILVVTLVAAFWYSWTAGAQGAMPPGPASVKAENSFELGAPPGVAVPSRVAAEPYRETIVQLESVLYQSKPPGYQDIQRASQLGIQLEQEIRRNEDSLRAAPFTMGLLAWVSNLDASMDVGYSAPDLKRARSQWEQLRSELFEEAAWFQEDSPEVETAQTPPPAEINRSTIRALKRVGNEIHHLITLGGAESREIGEIMSEVRTPTTARIENRWRKWRDNWLRRVQKVAEVFPAHPGMSANPNVVLAYQELERALHHLRIVVVAVNDFGVPFNYQRERNFQAAQTGLEQAEAYLAKIGS